MIDKNNLEKVLLKNWTSFIDSRQLIFKTLVMCNSNDYPISDQYFEGKNTSKISIIKFDLEPFIEITVSFSVPKESNILIGTHVFRMEKKELVFKSTNGMFLKLRQNTVL